MNSIEVVTTVAKNVDVGFIIHYTDESQVRNFMEHNLKYTTGSGLVTLLPIWEHWLNNREIEFDIEIVGRWYSWRYWMAVLTYKLARYNFENTDFTEYKELYEIEVSDGTNRL